VIASGAMPDEMTVTGNARLATGKVQAEFGTEGDWTGGIFANCMGNFDGISEHWYTHDGKRFDPTVGKDDPIKNGTTIQPTQYGFVNVSEPMMDWVRRPSNRVRLKAEAWTEYEKRFPALKEKKIFLSLDEWSYGRPSLKMALSYGMVMHEMFRHTSYMKMAAFTFGTTCVDFDSTDVVLNSNGTMFKFYRDHFGTLPVGVGGNAPQPAPKWPVGGDQPRVNAGSDTYPLDMVAAFTSDRKFLTVSVINATDTAQPIKLSFEGVRLSGGSKLYRLTGPSVDAANRLGQKPMVEVSEIAMPDVPQSLSVAPISINIYEFPVS
jgi:alpha-N-arabinofuranosidase